MIHCKFVKNGRDIGYCMGENEGDYLGFDAQLLKSAGISSSRLEGASMVILDTRETFEVRLNHQTWIDGSLSVRCASETSIETNCDGPAVLRSGDAEHSVRGDTDPNVHDSRVRMESPGIGSHLVRLLSFWSA